MLSRTTTRIYATTLLLGTLAWSRPIAAAATSYSLGYGGRAVDATGMPIAGPVDLKVSFFRAATGGEPILPTPLDFPATSLAQGVFQITMTLTAGEFTAVFADVAQPVYIQVTDSTHSVTYPRQQFLMVPFAAKVPVDGSTITYDASGQLTLTNPPGTEAKSLVQLDSASRLPAVDGSQLTGVMATGFTGKLAGDVSGGQASTTVTKIQGQPVAAVGATSGQVLTWTGGQWAPATPAAGSSSPISGPVNLSQAGAVTGTLAVANGGTGSGTTLNNNSLMISSGGAIVEAPALGNGQFFIGSAGTAPVAATLSQGTTQGVTVTAGAGSLALDTVQDIRTSATPLFSGLTLSNPAVGSVVKVGTGGTLVAAAPADLKATLGYTPVNKAGDGMSGSLGIGTTSATTTLDIAGAFTERGSAAPAIAPAGQGRLYFDSTANQFMVSQNGGAYASLLSGGTITGVTAGTGMAGGGNSGNVTVGLTAVGTSGTYTKVQTDANGRVTSGMSLTAADLPPIPASLLTSGTLSSSVIPALSASQITSGTLALAQISALPAAQITSGTLALAQIPALPAAQITSGTLGLSQIPALPAAQITSGTLGLSQIPTLPASQITSGTLALAQIPALPASEITGTLSTAQLPNLSLGEVTTGTLAVALGGTGATSFTNNGIVVGGGVGPLSTIAAGGQYNVLTVNASSQPVFGALNLGSAAAVSGTLPIASGGTGSSTALANNRLMLSAGGAIVEAPALTNGQLFVGSTGAAPAAATLAQGATQGVTFSAGAGSLTLDTAQDIRTSATPFFSSLKLTNPVAGSVVKVGSGGTLVAAAATDLTTTLGYTPVNKAGDTMGGSLSLGGFDLTNVGNIDMAASKTLAMGTFATDPSGLGTSDVGKTWFNTTSNQLKYWDGSTSQALGVSGAGLTSLNGQSGSTQTFGVPGVSGLSPTWSSASNTHTLSIPLASAASVTAGLLSNTDYQTFTGKVNKSGDTMTGSLGIGTTSAETTLDIAGALTERAMSAPAVAPTGQGRLYFDSTANQFMVSQNGGAYAVLASGGTITGVTAGTGLSGGGTSGSVSLALSSVGTAGTYTKVQTDANGRVTSGTTLAAGDLPPHSAALVTSGTLAVAQIPALPASQITTGTFAVAQIPTLPATLVSGTLAAGQIPALPASQITSGTFAVAQLPALPASQITSGTLALAQIPTIPSTQISGTLAAAQIPALPASQITSGTLALAQLPALPASQITSGTLAVAQIPAIPATQITGTLSTAQLPSLSLGEVTTGTLAVALGGTGATSFASNGVIIGGGATPLSATAAGSQYNILTVNASNQPVFGALNLGQTAAVTGTLPVASGGTGSSTALGNNRLMLSSGGTIVEAPALTSGQIFVGSTGAAPVAATLAQGATQGVTFTAGAGSLTLDTAQDIRTSATPLFSSLKLTNPAVGSVVKVGTGSTLVAAAAADLTSVLGYTPVNKAGDAMTGNLTTTGTVGIGTTSAETALDIAGALTERSIAAPAVSPTGQGRLYFDTTANQFMVSQNGSAYAPLGIGGTISGVTAGTGLTGGGTSGSVTLNLTSVGTAGTYTKVQTDANGRVTSGTTLAATDLPPHSAALVTSGTLAVAQIPSLPASQINSGTLAVAQIPSLPASQITSGTLALAQLPAIPSTQITGTLAIAQVPAIPSTQITGTLAVAQIPALPATQITGTLSNAQLPSLSLGEVTSGTLAVALGGTGVTSFTSNGVVVGGGGSPLSATAAGSQYNILTVNASNQPVFGALNLGQTAAVTGTLLVANGGTGSSTALGNNRLMLSSGGTIVEAPALTSGQIFVGSTGAAPVAATLAQGATQGVTFTAGAGSLTLDTAQDIRTSATPLFSSLKLTNPAVGSLVKVGTGSTLVAAAAADVTSTLRFTPVNKAGDAMTGNLTTTGTVGIGTTSAETALDVAGALTERSMVAPAVAPTGQGRLYFDTTTSQFMVSQNGGAYVALATGSPITAVTAGTGLTGGGTSGSVSLALTSVGTAGTYTKVLTDANGRVTSGTTLAAADLPPFSASLVTSGTLSTSVIPALPASQITSGTLAVAQIPALPSSQITSGTLALAQIPALPPAQITGTLAVTQIPALPASQITSGTLALAEMPALPATQITSGTLALAQVPALPASQITSGTLALAQVPTLPASQITSGTLAVAQLPAHSAALVTSGTLAVSVGGTGSTTALNNNRLMWSSGGAIVEAPALTNGQLFIGSSGAAPAVATLAQGTTQGVTFTAGAGSLTLDTAQDIRTSATPLFSNLKLSNPGVGSVVKVGTGGTLVAAAASDLTTTLGYTPVNKAGDTMTGTLNLPANGFTVGTTQLALSGGYVGIGTSTPGMGLEVDSSNSGFAAAFRSASNANSVVIGTVGGVGAVAGATSSFLASTLALNPNGGNVGIGTATPANKLDVSGGAAFGTYAGTAAPSNDVIVGGNVGIGTTSPSAQLHVVGQIVAALPATMTPGGTTQTVNFANGNLQVLNLGSATGTVTLTLSNAVAGGTYALKIVQGATAQSVTWPASVKWPSGIAVTLSTTNGAVDLVALFYDGTYFYANAGNNYQ